MVSKIRNPYPGLGPGKNVGPGSGKLAAISPPFGGHSGRTSPFEDTIWQTQIAANDFSIWPIFSHDGGSSKMGQG